MARQKDNFEAVRLLAAIAVMYGHAHPLTGSPGPGALGSSVQTLAVKVFFIVSGFLVSESWRRDPIVLRYLLRRILRIFPGLVTVTILTVFVIGPLLTQVSLSSYLSNPWTWLYLKNIILEPFYSLPGIFADNIYPNAVNGSLWTLPVECTMYLVLPVIASVGKRLPWRIGIGCFSLCLLSLYFNHAGAVPVRIVAYGTDWGSALDVAPYFFIGALWQTALPRSVLNAQVALLLVLLCCTIPAGQIVQEVSLYLILPYAVLSFALTKPALFGWLGRYGDFSYGIYIYGFFVQQIVSHFFKTDGRPHVNFAISLVPTILAAAASWRFVEKPFLKLKPTQGRLDLDVNISSGVS